MYPLSGYLERVQNCFRAVGQHEVAGVVAELGGLKAFELRLRAEAVPKRVPPTGSLACLAEASSIRWLSSKPGRLA